ncbi:hypothetical protein J0I05_03755 [Candidatus Saccharibacteria bacterium]|nr:hypothetical protein [Candidatus Saccharibacteria bacterium]
MSTPTTTTDIDMLDAATERGEQQLVANVTDARLELFASSNKLQSLLKAGTVSPKIAVALTALIDGLVDEDTRAATQARLDSSSPSSIEPTDALRVVLDSLPPARKNYVARGIVPDHPGYIKDSELDATGVPKELVELRRKNDELTANANAVTNGDAPTGMVKISDIKPLIMTTATAIANMKEEHIRTGISKTTVKVISEDDHKKLSKDTLLPLLAKVGVTPTASS